MFDWMDEILGKYMEKDFDVQKYVEVAKKRVKPKVEFLISEFKKAGMGGKRSIEEAMTYIYIFASISWIAAIDEVLNDNMG